VNRFLRSLALAAALSASLGVAALGLHAVGFPVVTAGAQVLNLFLLVLVIVYKEVNYESVMDEMSRRTDQILNEARDDRAVLQALARGFEALTRDHRQESRQALGEIKEAAAEVKQIVAGVSTPEPKGDG
jgi:hypothetical protein